MALAITSPVLPVPRPLLRQLKQGFKAKGCRTNCFMHVLHLTQQSLFSPELERVLIDRLADQGIVSPTGLYDMEWSVQSHNISVESHTDDGFSSRFFVAWVLHAKLNSQHASRFESAALFRYRNALGKRCETRLRPGTLVVFDASKPHELLYCGEEVLLAVGTMPPKTRRLRNSDLAA